MVRLVSRFRTVCNNPRITRILVRYYEVEILSPGSCAVGWALTDAGPDVTLGGDDTSWAYDGSRWIGFAKSFELFQILFSSAARKRSLAASGKRTGKSGRWEISSASSWTPMTRQLVSNRTYDNLQDMSGSKRKWQITRHFRIKTQITNYKTILKWQHGRISASRNEANYCCTAHSQPPSGVNSGDRQENHIRTAANTISQICKFGRFRAEFFQVGHLFDISCSMFWPASPNMFHHLTQLDFREYLLKKADISFTGLHQEF